MTWQYNNPPNPADAKNGPQTYDDHLYYSFGVSFLAPTSFITLPRLLATGRRRSEPNGILDQHVQ